MGVIETILDPVFRPLLTLGPFWALLIISFFVSLLITVIYKLVTDQVEMKRLKDEMKEYQKQMKEAPKDNATSMIDLQKKAMGANMQYMKHSFKPTLVTFIPIILIFGWLGAHLAYEPIMPEDEFTLTVTFAEGQEGNAKLVLPKGLELVGNATQRVESEASFRLKAVEEGDYFVDVEYDDKPYSKEVIVSKELRYASQLQAFDGPVKSIAIGYEKLVILPIGYRDWLGWLGLYIIFSLVFSVALRKVFKLY